MTGITTEQLDELQFGKRLHQRPSEPLATEYLRTLQRKAALLDLLVESDLIDRSIYPVDGKTKTAVLLAELRALYPILDSVLIALREAGVTK